MKYITLLFLVLPTLALPAFSADSGSEEELKRTGTAKSVPMLASLLADEDRWQSALDALETMPCAEAGEALRTALGSTNGKAKAAVAHALGERHDTSAVPDLIKLLADNDPMIAESSAQALGRIGGADALAALTDARRRLPAFNGPLLECAAHDRSRAMAIYAELLSPKEPDPVRAAAFREMVLASDDRGVTLVCDALKGTDAVAQLAAMPLVREFQGGNATKQFAAVLPLAAPVVQTALLDALGQRGDVAAAPAVAALVRSPDALVRVAAIKALGELGDASHVTALAAALAGAEIERDAARLVLPRLHRGDVGAALVTQIEEAQPKIQIELIQTLVRRGEKSAASSLLKLAQADDGKVSVTAVRALQELATETQAGALLDLILSEISEAMREAAESAFVAVAARTANREPFVEMVVKAMQGADVPVRSALLRTAGQIGGPKAQAALQTCANEPSPEIRDAAVRTMASHAGIEALPQLLALACDASNQTHRVLALRGYWRLVALAEKQPAQERLKLCQDGLAAAQRPDEKQLGLVELGKLALPTALELAKKLCADAAVKAEAELAAAQIQSRMASAQPKPEAQAGSKRSGPFLRDWLVCGPYSQEGVAGAERVFEIAFGPEKPGESVPWKPVPATGMVNLSAMFPAKVDCVAYLKTEIVSPEDCDATLLLGSDDGVKAWLNGVVVHSNNIDRPAVPDQDAAPIKLKKGANALLLKITQGQGGWQACARIVPGGGTPVAHTTGAKTAGTPAAHPAPSVASPPPKPSVLPKRDAFQKLRLTDQFYAEGAYFGDFNRDGKMDIVAGPFWFEGPDFQKRHDYRPAKTFDPKEYSDNFLTFASDFNADGWTDILCVGFPGKETYWYENPAGKATPWKQHLAYPNVGNESPVWGDLNADGRSDLIFCNDGHLGYATPDAAKPGDLWVFHAVSTPDKRYQRFTHGTGFGDINGDGRADAVEAVGWWEQPANAKPDQPWTFHPQPFAQAGAQMLVSDVDGDGLGDIITAWHCHLYGLVWWKQIKDAQGGVTWQQHVILPPAPDLNSADFRVSQMHALELVDMNGDGLKDILTGKRFWAHGPTGDKEPDAPAVVFWLELRRDGKAGVIFVPHLIDDDSGVGTQVAATDLNGDGRPDVIVANKKGIFVHLSQSAGGD